MARTKLSSRASKPPTPTPRALNPLPPNTLPILRPGQSAVAYHIPISPPIPSTPNDSQNHEFVADEIDNDHILKTTLSLPPTSTWSSGLHFHTTHTEYLHLIRGSISVFLDGQTRILSAAAGGEISLGTGKLAREGLVVRVDRYARHEWMRAEAWYSGRRRIHGVRPEDVDEDVVVEEWMEPGDLGKPLFFWNLNGIIMAEGDRGLSVPQRMIKSVLGSWWVPFQLFVVFWELDNWPVFLSLRGILGPALGVKPWVYRHVEGRLEYAVTFVVLFAAKMLGWSFGVSAVEQRRTPNELWEAYKRHGI